MSPRFSKSSVLQCVKLNGVLQCDCLLCSTEHLGLVSLVKKSIYRVKLQLASVTVACCVGVCMNRDVSDVMLRSDDGR